VTRHGTGRRHPAQPFHYRQPALEAAVDHRDPLDEQQVAQPQGRGLAVQHCQVVVGMAGRMGHQLEDPLAEVELQAVGHDQAGGYHLGAVHRVAQRLAHPVQIVAAAGGQRARQLGVTDEDCPGLGERTVSERMVLVDVGVDHVAQRQISGAPHRSKELCALLGRAAAVDHCDRLVADHESDVRDPRQVLPRHLFVDAGMDVEPRRHLGDREALARRVGGAGEREEAGERAERHGPALLHRSTIRLQRSMRAGRAGCGAVQPPWRAKAVKVNHLLCQIAHNVLPTNLGSRTIARGPLTLSNKHRIWRRDLAIRCPLQKPSVEWLV